MDFWLQRTLSELDAATAGISPEQMSWHPAEGKWSVSQILEHLDAAFSSTVVALRKVVDAGKPTAGPGSAYQSLATFVVTGLGYFPSGRPAPAWTLPKDAAPEQVSRAIRENLVAMDAVLTQAESKFGRRVKIANHPIIGPFNVTEWRKFHYVHTRHHMKQVRAIRARLPELPLTADQRG